MGENEQKGVMQAEIPFAMVQAYSCVQRCGRKGNSFRNSSFLKTSRACQESAAATASAAKERSKATV